jgi:hypothetical protein
MIATYMCSTNAYGNPNFTVFKCVEAVPEGELYEEETGRFGKQRGNPQLLMSIVLLALTVG